MANYKKGVYIILIILLIFLVVFSNYFDTDYKELPDLNSDIIADVEIIDQYNHMEELYNNPEKEEYVLVDIIMNGQYFKDVGIRTKGSSNIYNIIKNSINDREHSFKIKLNYTKEKQTYNGIDEFHLNTGVPDKSRIREYLVYKIYNDMGIQTQMYCFANVSINNVSNGLFTMVEVINERYVNNKYDSSLGNLYKPVKQTKYVRDEVVLALEYTYDSIDKYDYIFDYTKTKGTNEEDKKRLISLLKKINNCNQNDIEEVFMDFDKIIKIMAINTAVENLDNFYNRTTRNYFLYEENGIIDILPFDFNMSFGRNGNTKAFLPSEVDDIDIFKDNKIYSMITKIVKQNPEYQKKYYEYISETLKLLEKYYVGYVDELNEKIEGYVRKDKVYIFSYEEYEKEIQEVKKFILSRIEYLNSELQKENVFN